MLAARITRNILAFWLAVALALCGLFTGSSVAAADEVAGSTAQTEPAPVVQPVVKAPKAPTFKVKSKGGKSMKLAISQKGKVAGYQVKYRVASGKWKAKSSAKKSVTLKKMKINHTYQIKVRSFKLDANGKRVYSAYSKAKKVFNGVKPLKSSEIKKMWYQPFIHGTKKKGQQRYIMLHDTESYSGPENIVEGWKSDNGGTVAAHFVVGRDGKVVQTARLKRILHHAGYGGPGNYDRKFGVGSNNGRGTGDDLRGKVHWSGYTSYGMNSYSIGIEMCHVNGQNYTKAQLKAVDRLIAYIDKLYGGYGGKIIDHKDWRPSNSDTDANFAKYLKNYKKYRKHTV
jgi:hypothetical protein